MQRVSLPENIERFIEDRWNGNDIQTREDVCEAFWFIFDEYAQPVPDLPKYGIRFRYEVRHDAAWMVECIRFAFRCHTPFIGRWKRTRSLKRLAAAVWEPINSILTYGEFHIDRKTCERLEADLQDAAYEAFTS